ncbi:MAG: hypothetical protein CL912_12085 [Deltaproteobacteria bacterium]|nr:hypothetical protein [Deltaproteobacteria bacterium]
MAGSDCLSGDLRVWSGPGACMAETGPLRRRPPDARGDVELLDVSRGIVGVDECVITGLEPFVVYGAEPSVRHLDSGGQFIESKTSKDGFAWLQFLFIFTDYRRV